MSKYNYKLEVYVDNAKEHRFRIRSSNGRIVAQSEGYKLQRDCIRACQRLKKKMAEAVIVVEG